MQTLPLISVLLTCFNRKALTLRLLSSLYQQQHLAAELCILVVDDGCTDGTADAIRQQFPQVHLVRGSGELYWCGGMRLAQQSIHSLLSRPADYQLWLNDDVELDPDALARLVAQAQALERQHKLGAIVGAVRSPDGRCLTYGGRRSLSRWFPLTMSTVLAESVDAQPCDFINGNICLLPAAAIAAAGDLSADFTHSMGDFDYGLRLQQFGFSLWQAAGSYGSCQGRAIRGSIRDRSLPLVQRLALLAKPNHAAPVGQWQTFLRRHGGPFWRVLALKAQCRAWWPRLYLKRIAQAPEHKRVVVVQQVLRQYRLAFWQQLHTELAAQNVQLLVLFGQPDAFEAQKRDTISSPPADWFIPCEVTELGPFVWQYHPVIQAADLVICEHASRHLLPWYLTWKRQTFAWWGHGYDHQAPRHGLRAWWKQQLLSLGSHYFAYTERVADYLQTLGLASSQITVVYNSQDCLDVAKACQSRRAPAAGLTALYCGSLYQEKRLDLLLEAAELALSRGLLKQLIIMGDGPQRAAVQARASDGIHLVGALFGQEKAQMFARADLVLNPGMTGLAILDAFNAGLPYISCSDSAHSPEIDYLKHGQNGFLVPGDAKSICQALEQLQQGTLWRQLSLGALKSAEDYQLATMVRQFKTGVCHALGIHRYQVCLVHHAYQEPGGEDIVVQRDLQWLRQQGFDVCLHQTVWPASAAKRALQFGWRLLWPAHTRQIPAAAVYWLHNTQGSFGLAAAAQLSRRGSVWQTLHNVRPLWPGGVFRPGQWFDASLATVLTAWRDRPYRQQRLLSALLAMVNWRHRAWHTQVQRLVCPSAYVRAQYQRAGYSPAALWLKPHHCPAPLQPQSVSSVVGILRCLYVGRVDASKGLPWLLNQWPALQECALQQGLRCQLTVITHSTDLPELPPDTAVYKADNWSQLSSCYQQADLVFVPSLVCESFGNVVIEAAAHGVAVLGSNAGALAELVPHCLGYVFNAGDPVDFQRQFAKALAEMQTDSRPLRAQRQAVWSQYYSTEQHAVALITDLRELTAP